MADVTLDGKKGVYTCAEVCKLAKGLDIEVNKCKGIFTQEEVQILIEDAGLAVGYLDGGIPEPVETTKKAAKTTVVTDPTVTDPDKDPTKEETQTGDGEGTGDGDGTIAESGDEE